MEKMKRNSEELMEEIRKNPPRVKSINDVVNLLHVISAEQRSCNVLRSCVDKVLMNMSNIRTLRDIIERLRSVSRTNGFRFELPTSASPETRCHLVSEMFSVKIVLGTQTTPDHSPTVVDVSIKHKEDYKSCPHLAKVIRAGNFLELSNHLKGIMEMYSTSGSKQSRTKVYLALQSLETDLAKMSQMYRETHKDSSIFDITMEGTVGFLTPRLAGDRPHFAYYISPYDLIDTSSKCRITLQDNVPKNIGLHAEVGIEQRNSSCMLPISPLITNKHPIDSSGMPRLLDVSHHNSTSVQACFVLHLKPPVPVVAKVANDISKLTNLELCSDSGESKKFLELLGAEKNTFKVLMGEECHVYRLDLSEMKGTLVDKVYFTQPGHVINILEHLRKQAHLNTLLSSCIRDLKNAPLKSKEWYFEISCGKDVDKVNVTMEHPSSRGTAFLEIKLTKDGFPGCKIFTGRGDPPLCNDDFVVRILRKCSSLPIAMRKVIEQSIKNPKKESDVGRKRPPALFAPSTQPPPPTILSPVLKLPIPQPQQQPIIQQQQATSAVSFNPIGPSAFPFGPSPDPPKGALMPKKCVDNPMLTQLLIPSSGSSDIREPTDQPIRSHPMLLTLLKEDSDQESQIGQNRNMQLSNAQLGPNPTMVGNNTQQNQFNSSGFMSPNTTFPSLDPPIPIPTSHAMPPPSSPLQNQFNPPGQLPVMSPQVPHSPYSSQPSPLGGMDDITGPVTPTNPFGMMSPGPGLISPGIAPGGSMQAISRVGRKKSRQKSQSMEGSDMSVFDLPQYGSQMSVESNGSISEMLGMPSLHSRTAMMPLRRTESMSPGGSVSQHMPLQHSTSLKSISETSMGLNPLTRSISATSSKSPRSMASPGPRGLRTPDGMSTLESPPMFDPVMLNQRGSRVKSYDSHTSSDLFRSSLTSPSPLGLSVLPNPDSDPFTFDDNKNPSKISMSENLSTPASRGGKPAMYSSPLDKDETLRELAKTKPGLLKALTGDAPTIKTESALNMPKSGLLANLNSASQGGAFDFPTRLMTSTSVSTVSEKPLVRQNAVDRLNPTTTQGKTVEAKSEKPIKRRNSSKNEEGKTTAKKRGRPPTVKDKDHGGKRRKGDITGGTSSEESSSNLSVTLNIQLSSNGAPISSTTKTKPVPGSTPPQKIPGSNNTSGVGHTNPSTSAMGNTEPAKPTINFGSDPLSQYFKSQQELQQKMKVSKDVKEKKGTTKALTSKMSFGGQSSGPGSTASNEKTPGVQSAKPGAPQRAGSGLPAPRKRKASIKDIADKLQSKMSETPSTTGALSPDKLNLEKDANSNLLTKKTLLSNSPYQKSFGSGLSSKTVAKGLGDEKSGKATLVPKLTKLNTAKLPQGVVVKPPGTFTPVNTGKGRLPSDTQPIGKSGESIDEVLKKINQAAARSTQRNTMSTPINKTPTAKVARPGAPVKARSTTPTSMTPTVGQNQRKSPSDITGRSMPIKSTNTGSTTPPIAKKSPHRNQNVGNMPVRAGSVSSDSVGSVKHSASAAMLSLSRKATSADQHFATPSISPTPKRTTSPQIQRTTSPLTRVEDKLAKGMTGRSPHRPSPTQSRISTPVPSSSPRSPDDRLMIVDDTAVSSGATPASFRTDEQKPAFISGNQVFDRQSPERAVMPSPLSPPPLAQKPQMAQITKRAPTPRSNISPMSPASCPYSPDDDLMDEAVT